MIIACGPIPNGGALVYVVAVTQPVQSWSVLRSHDDFVAVGQALSQVLTELPPCPILGNENDISGDLAAVVKARNDLQEWLSAILMYPGARESSAVRDFLTMGANTIPPQYEGVVWTQFNTMAPPAVQQRSNPSSPPSTPYSSVHVDDMDMDDMFLADDEDADPEDHEDDDDMIIPSASVRYKPTNEKVTDEDEMDIMGEVEMVEDIGSLAQSLGASHLGRSLQLQAEMNYGRQQHSSNSNNRPVQGLNVGGAAQHRGPTAGGIGSAMARANQMEGMSNDAFHQRVPESAPRLDSFKMIKVIGKGSFGKQMASNDCCVQASRTEYLILSLVNNQAKSFWSESTRLDISTHSKFSEKTI